MKKLTTLLIALLTVFMISCSKPPQEVINKKAELDCYLSVSKFDIKNRNISSEEKTLIYKNCVLKIDTLISLYEEYDLELTDSMYEDIQEYINLYGINGYNQLKEDKYLGISLFDRLHDIKDD